MPVSGRSPSAKSAPAEVLQKQLVESQKRLEAIFDSVQAGIIVIDAVAHRIVDANRKALEMIGASREEVVGSECHRFICPAEKGQCPITDLKLCIDNSQRVLLNIRGEEVPILKTVASIDIDGRPHLVESFLDLSQQIKTQHALRTSEERYRDLFENANDLIQAVGPDGHFLYVNRAWRETLGYSEEEIPRLTIKDIIHPDCMAHCMDAFQQLMQGASFDRMETVFLTRDGRPIEVEGSINCSFEHGRPLSSRGIFRNITERKRAEQNLRESEERYRDLFENANDLIQAVAPDGSFLYVNRAWRETLGYSEEEVKALRLEDIVHDNYRQSCMNNLQRVVVGGRIDGLETIFLTKDRRPIWVEGNLSCSRIAGHQVASRGIFRDISDRKRAERARRKSEERYRDLFDNVHDLIQMASPKGTFIYVNPAWRKALGYDDDEVTALSFADIIAAECLDDFWEVFAKMADGKEASDRLETIFCAKDGKRIPVEGTVSFQYQRQVLVGVRFLWRDITERKRAREMLEDWNRQLEAQVEQKTRQLKEAQAKLLQTEKMATIGQLASGAAHELSNPLGGILAAVQVLHAGKMAAPASAEGEEECRWLQAVEKAARRCQGIVDDLKRFSEEALCAFAPVNLNDVITAALREVAAQFPHAKERLVNHCRQGAPRMMGDAVQLQQALSNILANAVEASDAAGTVEVACQMLPDVDGEPQLQIAIRDGGCGIPVENLGKIFDPFFTTKAVGSGPGLGLSVSYGIVKRHHGDIDVSSRVAEGTEVLITLPLRLETDED